MTGREIVLAAVAGERPDRTPYAFRAEPETCEKLYRHLGFHDYDRLVDFLNPDIHLVQGIFPPEKDFGSFYQNYWGERYVYKQTEFGPVREDQVGALATAQSLEDLEAFPWPRVDDVDHSRIRAAIDRHPGRAIQYGAADIWQRPGLVRGMAEFLADLALNPEFCHYLSDLFTRFYVEEYTRAQEAAGGRIDLFTVYSDLGSQHAPLISDGMFREFVFPYVERMAKAVHGLGGRLFFHSCGAVHPFVDGLIEAGIDILDPIQPCAPEMQPESLARRFGGRVCFHGGVDVQQVLSVGTPDDVRASIARYKTAFAGCGFVCAPSHYIQMDASVENILAIYEECRADREDR